MMKKLKKFAKINKNCPKILDYDYWQLLDSPVEYEDKLLYILDERYSKYVEKIFQNIENYCSSNLLSKYKKKIERHLFPALVLSTDLGISKKKQ